MTWGLVRPTRGYRWLEPRGNWHGPTRRGFFVRAVAGVPLLPVARVGERWVRGEGRDWALFVQKRQRHLGPMLHFERQDAKGRG